VNYLKEYYRQIQEGEILVGKELLTVLEGLIEDLNNPRYTFDEKPGKIRIDFIETFCKHTKSPFNGEPFILELWEKAVLQVAYGFKMADTNLRRFNARIPKFEIKERVSEALKIVGLEDYQERKPANLSGGQRQRVALARAISKTPQCFLMDEPLSNLDAKLRSEMRTELIQLHQKLMSTFIYVTHDQIEAMTMGDNIVVMNEGKIMQQGTPSEIHNDPNCVFVAKFIGDPGMNIIKVDEKYSIGFRPRDVQFDSEKNEEEDAVFVKTKILSFENHGSEFLYLVNFDTTTAFVKELSKHNRKVSSEISFSILKKDMYIFDENDNRVYDQEKIEEAYGTFKTHWENV
jgi:sn-glycerol 3-phosphate transport system ATP-binding protein